MKNVSITLKLDGKQKKFVTPNFIPGVLFRKAAECAEMVEQGELSGQDLDALVSFVCEVFNHKFTIEEFEEGTDSRLIGKTIYAVINYVMGNVTAASELLGGEVKEEDKGKSD
ncbi:phage tail assembly chaperone G [Virgibacillus pantothenticus]|uniref:Phage protein n=1 Tax=Virgibacillus pantothenticus TaxID=1473 RepID=A0A0L0QM50_VIRPA|nr:hypothetical protein [Virgibacillus pantothenticus]KNE19672.1 hypothetical protein AFK71_14545 [Virgibacillus pantothenticus]MED3736622.1 hypothetical protein [Virgibacillus pantothenticus]QTY14799.1 hypothetical protein KBP50_12740 [Virgibacillus pantothenticus]SIS79613.1 hypothetical protein SAMN05421787_103283 [Virgibacillus pantothenticus]